MILLRTGCLAVILVFSSQQGPGLTRYIVIRMLGSYQRKMIFLIIDGTDEPQANGDPMWEKARVGSSETNLPWPKAGRSPGIVMSCRMLDIAAAERAVPTHEAWPTFARKAGSLWQFRLPY